MRDAETVLGVIRERGRRRLPLEDIYRQLYNQDLFLRAYGRIYRNDGAMTPGSTPETVDAMSLEKIDTLIELIRREGYLRADSASLTPEGLSSATASLP
jgi:hypothetical protein